MNRLLLKPTSSRRRTAVTLVAVVVAAVCLGVAQFRAHRTHETLRDSGTQRIESSADARAEVESVASNSLVASTLPKSAQVPSIIPQHFESTGAKDGVPWLLTTDDHLVVLNVDRGAWIDRPLPDDLSSPDIASVSVAHDGTVLVSVVDEKDIRLYRSPQSSPNWGEAEVLQPNWPDDLPTGYAGSSSISTTVASDQYIAVIATVQLGHATFITRIFTSTDGGASFSRVHEAVGVDGGTSFDDVLVISPGVFMAVTGNARNRIMRSDDDGTTWHPVSVAPTTSRTLGDSESVTQVAFGSPFASDKGIDVAATTNYDGGQSTVILRSADQGKSFAIDGPPLDVANDRSTLPLVTHTQFDVWVVPAGAIAASKLSTDGWSPLSPMAAPGQTVSWFTMDSEGNGAAAISRTDCGTIKGDCVQTAGIVLTHDGGNEWQSVKQQDL